jgi:eukaryotic-like serine/threonine-protein kinase
MSARTATLPDRYRDPRLVASGGMGDVYCATDTVLSRPVAVKLLDERHASDPTVRKRFTREALAAARLSSDLNVVTVFDVGEWEGRPFIVMEYLPGGSLDDVLRREGAQTPVQALEWLEQAGKALDRAHERGIVHRDVKPANLLLDRERRVHVADFGVASTAGLDSLTLAGTVIGTAGYLSPEQAEGREATPASDRYGLGVVAFELLAGTRPFENESPTAEAIAHVRSPVPSIAERRSGLPPAVDAVFARALAKDPADRFPTSVRFVTALRAAFSDREATTRIIAASRRPPVPRHRNRGLLPLALALPVAAVGILAAVLLTRPGGGTSAQRSVVTVTGHGNTVQRTVTVHRSPAPATTSTPATTTTGTTTAAAAGNSRSGSSAALQGYAKMQAGDYARALPLLEQAAHDLRGSRSNAEAYNDYNLAYSLAKTQGCSSQVLQLLDASQAIQGRRSEIDGLRKACRRSG